MKDEHVEEELLQRYFDGELDAAQKAEVAGHVERCERCAERVRGLSELHRVMGIAAEESARGVDFDALFGRIERGVAEQPRAGVVERLSFAMEERGQRPRQILMPVAVGLAAAAALLLVLRPQPPTGQSEGAPVSSPAAAATSSASGTGSSELDEVDFGAKTGTVYVPGADGVEALVVWIDDDDDKGTE
ncbi:MAG: anti-sigma factor family protein [Polyangiales bacterium]